VSGTAPEIFRFSHIEQLIAGSSIELKGQWIEVEVPRFQRGYVWSEPRQKALVHSIRDGLPIGSIVLCKSAVRVDEAGKLTTTYQLVDGLQRSLTIAAATRNPYLWGSEHHHTDQVINRDVLDLLLRPFCSDKAGNIDVKKAVRIVVEYIHKHQKEPANINTGSLWSALRLGMEMTGEAGEDQWRLLQQLINGIESGLSIANFEIPALLYTGPISNAPRIFELLNQQGQKLSPYQVYAAGWVDDSVTLNAGNREDAVLLQLIKDREEFMQQAGYVLEGKRDLSLFDVLNGLGNKWSSTYPHLFSQTTRGSESSIGFQMAALYHGIKATDKSSMQKLPHRFPHKQDKSIDHLPFTKSIEAALQMLDMEVGRYLRFNFRAKHRKTDTSLLSDLQVASIAVWLAHRNERSKTFDRSHITRRLVLDAINRVWEGGPIDALAFKNVWESRPDSEATDLASTYDDVVSDEEWAAELSRWFDSQMKDRTRKRKSPSKSQKLVLKLIASTNMNFAEEQDEFEIDHLFSVKGCQDAFKARSEGWPLNSIANLGVLVVRANREKSTKSIHEWYYSPPPAGPEKLRSWNRRREQSLRSLGISEDLLNNWQSSDLSEVVFKASLRRYWAEQLKVLQKI
jgi:hypothetical protein